LRSSYITTFVAALLVIGIGALVCAVTASHWNDPRNLRDHLNFDPVFRSLVGVNIAQLAVGVLGVMLFSGEYSTGMIRSTMAAVPKRLPVLWGKLGVFIALTGVVSVVSTLAAFFAGQSLLSSRHIQASLSDPGAVRKVLGAALYLVVVGVIAVALGAILRNTAAGISTLVALFFVIPPLLNQLPTSWQNNTAPYLPGNAGSGLWSRLDSNSLAPWTGMGVMVLWAVGFVAVAAVLLRRRDA
jgi:ABC-type transport system involved in multi-copper enzyme maturation permease subunit